MLRDLALAQESGEQPWHAGFAGREKYATIPAVIVSSPEANILGRSDEMWQRVTAVFELQVICTELCLRSPIKEAEVSPFFCWRRPVNTSDWF